MYREAEPGHFIGDPVGKPIPHLSAMKQVTGEAVYVDDISPYSG